MYDALATPPSDQPSIDTVTDTADRIDAAWTRVDAYSVFVTPDECAELHVLVEQGHLDGEGRAVDPKVMAELMRRSTNKGSAATAKELAELHNQII